MLWTRSYALVIGSSVYAFNLMLLAVLLGIAIGAALYARPSQPHRRPRAEPSGRCSSLAGLAVLAGAWTIGRLPVVSLAALKLLPVSFAAHQLAFLRLCFATLSPVTAILGLELPAAAPICAAGRERRTEPLAGAQRAAGRLYAWNTAGAIAGALAADLVLVPELGLQAPYLVFAALLVAARRLELALGRVAAVRRRGRAVALAAVVVAAIALVPRFRPWDPVLMTLGRPPLRARVDPPARLALAPRGPGCASSAGCSSTARAARPSWRSPSLWTARAASSP